VTFGNYPNRTQQFHGLPFHPPKLPDWKKYQ